MHGMMVLRSGGFGGFDQPLCRLTVRWSSFLACPRSFEDLNYASTYVTCMSNSLQLRCNHGTASAHSGTRSPEPSYCVHHL